MAKRRLSNRQIKQQSHLQASRIERAKQHKDISYKNNNSILGLGPEQSGCLIAHYGTTLIVESQAGRLYQCTLRQNLGTLVTGDEVIWQAIDDATGVVVACQPRRSVITRPNQRASKPMVANVDLMLIVVAFEPLPLETTLARYLILAQMLHLGAIIIANKSDLAPDAPSFEFLHNQLTTYRQLGYPIFTLSAKTQYGLEDLKLAIKDQNSVLVGQSGVGKSSLLTCLVPNAKVQIQALSETHRLGKHTTTASRLYHLPSGGNIIDSPGIHQFDLHHFTQAQLIKGFKEFTPFLGQCQFRNCKHLHEPGCALQKAILHGKIAPFRLQNYHAIISDKE